MINAPGNLSTRGLNRALPRSAARAVERPKREGSKQRALRCGANMARALGAHERKGSQNGRKVSTVNKGGSFDIYL
jgi:hypothetical protein